MKKIIIILLFISIELSYSQQIFKPFRKLYTIQTKKFEIIFPIESKRTAEKLAIMVDNIYEEYSKILDVEIEGKIPITLSPDINIYNAMGPPVPYPLIIIYDTPESGNSATYNNNLKSLFIHELTHILSLAPNQKTGIQTKIFGSWANLVFINTPAFMLEGVTVLTESYNGFGRVNDPLVRQRLRQDIYEGKFKTPLQASDLWIKKPWGNVYYEYGGLLSQYLKDRFGIEKYNKLWEQMRKNFSFSFNPYNAGFYGAFKKVYGFEFLEIWGDFQAYLTLKDIKPSEEIRVDNKNYYIYDIDAYNDTLYYIEGINSALYSYKKNRNSINNKEDTKLEFYIDKSSETIDVSKDGRYILITSMNYNFGLYKYVVKEYDLQTKKRTKRKWENINEAQFFKSGIVGISKDLHNSTFIYIDENNNIEELLPPNDNITYSSPTVIDENSIAIIITEKGIKRIAIYNYNDKTLKYVNSYNNTLNYVRYLKESNGKILFSYNNNDRFYKLGELDIVENTLTLYEDDYSGGVFNAINVIENETNNTIYFRGSFSEYDKLMFYPTNSLRKVKYISYIPKTIKKYQYNENNNYFKIENFNEAKYFKPWTAWIPIPLYNDSFQYFFNGIGVVSVVANPYLNNLTQFWLGYDIASQFLQTDIYLTSYTLLHPLNFTFGSKVVYGSSSKYWTVNSSINMSFILNTESDKAYFSVSPVLSTAIFSKSVDLYSTKTAFEWQYQGWSLATTLVSSFTFSVPTDKPYIKDYIKLSLYPTYSIAYNRFAIDFKAYFQSRYIPIRANIFGSYVPNGIAPFNGASTIFIGRYVKGFNEFYNYVYSNDYRDSFLLGGEFELFGYLDAEFNLSHIYFNNFFASLLYRYNYYAKDYMHSVGAKVGTKANILVIPYNVITGEPYLEVALKVPTRSSETVSINDLYFGFGFEMSW